MIYWLFLIKKYVTKYVLFIDVYITNDYIWIDKLWAYLIEISLRAFSRDCRIIFFWNNLIKDFKWILKVILSINPFKKWLDFLFFILNGFKL
jgi:hypothetical protein